ncbi:MAG: hypothetical protein LBJ59_12080 [Zoogloeaceae bacterium]|jgi:hypothetical protein|nr:hypothetical protein [Zoogloeaceae bacterium]
MNFKMQEEPTVWWPVTIRLPADGGVFVEQKFEAKIRVLPESEYAQFSLREDVERGMAETLAENARLLPRLVLDWIDVSDEAGHVTILRLPELLTHSAYGVPLSIALWQAIAEVRYGLPSAAGATEKNSEPSPEPGATAALTS